MSDRLPPEIAALLTDGEQLVVGDLVLADVRRLLDAVAAKLATQRGVISLLERDVANTREALRALTHEAGNALMSRRHRLFDAYGNAFLLLGAERQAAISDNPTTPAEGAIVEGPQG